MQDSDPQWKILRCPHCDGLMKVAAASSAESLACPSCCDTFTDPDIPLEGGGSDTVISSGDLTGGSSETMTEIDLDIELGAIPEIEPLKEMLSAGSEVAIPARRKEEFKMPEMISNIGERIRSRVIEPPLEPKLDSSRLASIHDERFAPVEDDEEGSVQEHVARKITGWDVDGDGSEVGTSEASDSSVDQVKGKLGVIVIALVCLLFVCVLGYGLTQSTADEGVETKSSRREAIDSARESLTSIERDMLDNRDKLFAEGGIVIEQFLNAENYKQRVAFVRDSERVGPLMEAYYQDNPDGSVEFRAPEDGWQFAPFETFLLGRVEGNDFSWTSIAIEREDERFLVDWESFVGYCEIPWDKITEQKSTTPFLVRARASIGDYYNYGYSENEWACVRMDSENREHTVYAYVKLTDPILDEVMKVLTPNVSSHVTVRLAHPGEGKAANQFLVTEVISSGWVTDPYKKDE